MSAEEQPSKISRLNLRSKAKTVPSKDEGEISQDHQSLDLDKISVSATNQDSSGSFNERLSAMSSQIEALKSMFETYLAVQLKPELISTQTSPLKLLPDTEQHHSKVNVPAYVDIDSRGHRGQTSDRMYVTDEVGSTSRANEEFFSLKSPQNAENQPLPREDVSTQPQSDEISHHPINQPRYSTVEEPQRVQPQLARGNPYFDYAPVNNFTPTVINQISPPEYNGDEASAHTWLRDYENIMRINGYSTQQILIRSRAYLKGKAADWYDVTLDLDRTIDWPTLKRKFLNHFCGTNSKDKAIERLHEATQGRNERPNHYLIRVLKLCSEVDRNMSEEEKLRKLIKGLNFNILNSLLAAKPRSLWTIDWLHSVLIDMRLPPSSEKPDLNKSKPRQATTSNKSGAIRDLSDWLCFNCNKKGHVIKDCTIPKDSSRIAANKEAFLNKDNPTQNPEATPKIISSFNKSAALDTDILLPCDSIRKPILALNVNGRDISGRVDSGADFSVLPSSIAS